MRDELRLLEPLEPALPFPPPIAVLELLVRPEPEGKRLLEPILEGGTEALRELEQDEGDGIAWN